MLIHCEDLDVGYGDLKAGRSINIRVSRGEVVALIGPNGAGKTTTLLTLVGELPSLGGRVFWEGKVTRAPLHVLVRKGLAFISEKKVIVSNLSVRDNLKIGHAPEKRSLELFPELEPLLSRRAGLLSGGEQQILSLARALARNPTVVIVDELSLGLAPLVAERLAMSLRAAAQRGAAVLVVEQNLRQALALSDRFYVMRQGEVTHSVASTTYRDRIDDLTEMLLPTSDGGPIEFSN